ncbi:hypothetical protein IAQ61_006344, partial [Plenodomus lingam]|uniref:Predicted protein n=1 Tax=Leptosphaeria maculans (strain JN3 / isolate v23.1.3 / race Av1-4-5-6-7-8) TaxID=985895 RepID=E4ZSB2_LEPMJ
MAWHGMLHLLALRRLLMLLASAMSCAGTVNNYVLHSQVSSQKHIRSHTALDHPSRNYSSASTEAMIAPKTTGGLGPTRDLVVLPKFQSRMSLAVRQ